MASDEAVAPAEVKMVQLNVQVPSELRDWLARQALTLNQASDEHISSSSIVRELLEQYRLDEERREVDEHGPS